MPSASRFEHGIHMHAPCYYKGFSLHPLVDLGARKSPLYLLCTAVNLDASKRIIGPDAL